MSLTTVDGSLISSGAITLTTQVTGTLPEANGGTGTTVGYCGFKNRIINGAMVIDQRNAGLPVTPNSSTYTLDRWRIGVDTTQRMSFQQVSDAPAGFTNSILCTVTTSGSTSASNLLYLQQNIEGFNVSDFGFGTASAQTVSVSFWVKSSIIGLKSISLINASLSRAYCTTYNIDTANTWEYKTVTIPGDTSGTWGTGNGNGLELHFNFQIGSTYETTLNTWAAGRFYSASSVPDITTTSGATINITGVQLEKGSTATSFDYRPYGTELALCQRYFEKSYNQESVPGVAAFTPGFASSVSSSIAPTQANGCTFKVFKRVNPTVVTFNAVTGASGTSYRVSDAASVATTLANPGQNGIGYIDVPSSANGYYWHFTASAEL